MKFPKIQFWPAFWSVVGALLVFPVIGLILSAFYHNWTPFKLGLLEALPAAILLLAISILWIIYYFIKKWLKRLKG